MSVCPQVSGLLEMTRSDLPRCVCVSAGVWAAADASRAGRQAQGDGVAAHPGAVARARRGADQMEAGTAAGRERRPLQQQPRPDPGVVSNSDLLT